MCFAPSWLREQADPRDVAARAVERINQARLDRIVAAYEDDRDDRRCRFRRECGGRRAGEDDRRRTLHQFGRQPRETIILPLSPAILDRRVAAIDVTCLGKAATERVDQVRVGAGQSAVQESHHRHSRLLRACRKRPRGPAAE